MPCPLPGGASIAIMSTVSPLDALRGAQRPGPKTATLPRLLLAGATGPLGNEVLSRVVGAQNYALVQVLAREPYVHSSITRSLFFKITSPTHDNTPFCNISRN